MNPPCCVWLLLPHTSRPITGCGSVYAGIRISDGLPVALKYATKIKEAELLIPGQEVGTPREVGLMDMGHPNILRLYEWFDAPDHCVMVLERPDPCMDLVDFCKSQFKTMDEHQARAVIDQLLHALLHCQHAGVFHRDVKPTNILINTETLRVILIDFGCGDLWRDTPFSTFAGTTEFIPPEWFVKGLYQAGPATVWSVGVTLFGITCGYLPFNPCDDHESMSRVHYPDGLSSEIKDFMRRCLTPEVEDRATLEQLQHHPWLQPTCLAQVGFRKRNWESEEDGEQKRNLSSYLIPAKCHRKDRDGGSLQKQLHLLILHSPGAGGQCFQGEYLSEHGHLAPVLSLGCEQQEARRSPPKTEPSEDELSHAQSQQFLSACSSLWTYFRCQSTASERSVMNDQTGVSRNQKIPANCLMKAPEKHQRIGLKRKMEYKEQAVVLENLGPYSKTPAKRPRKDQDAGRLLKQLQLVILHSPGGGGQGSEGEDLNEHGRWTPGLAREQRGARRSPQKLGPSEDLSRAEIGKQSLSACSSLWTYDSCQSTGPPSSCPPSTQPAEPADRPPMLLSNVEPGALAFTEYGPQDALLCLGEDLQDHQPNVLVGLIK
ncbi:hypothetical protein SKAU_G00189910 [Synaphobranchus kaupii]|uniref:non-specific serine/threonine protein kinase n=1 Tax=Synaphobranchus kaupii TaxID=118154 RepID=A0A9Q1IV36_SYNKA|nr:hypothetical protein SKAU_G00189910 [Synaphobranchus kaupii]